MAITLSTGVAVSIASTYGNAVNMTALSNAPEAVATLDAGHNVVVGDWLEISSGWGLLDKRLARVKTVATNAITLEGIDTSNATKYPAGTGVGTIRRITAWQALSQLKSISASGGDIQFANISALDDVVAKQVPTIRSATTMNIDVFDDPTLPWYPKVAAASDARSPFGLMMAFPNGSKLGANAYWSLQRVPSIAANEALTSQISLSYASEPTRYPS